MGDDRCRAVFHHRCTKQPGHGGAHASGDSAELLAEVARLTEALCAAREIIYHEFSGDPTEPWGFIDEALGQSSSEPARAPVIAEDLDEFADGEKEHPKLPTNVRAARDLMMERQRKLNERKS